MLIANSGDLEPDLGLRVPRFRVNFADLRRESFEVAVWDSRSGFFGLADSILEVILGFYGERETIGRDSDNSN